MAQVIWKGEAELCRENELPPAHTTWGKYKFPVGQPVEVHDEWLIAKARANKFFDVIDDGKPFAFRVKESNTGPAVDPWAREEIPATDPPKRKGGWPKGKKRTPKAAETVTDGADH